MSTEDDRPKSTGGYADSGYFTPSEPRSTDSGYNPPGQGYDQSPYSDGPTTVLPTPDVEDDGRHRAETVEREPLAWHVGADLGLLVLRVTLGALFLAHGLQKVFGLMQGPGIDGFAQVLGSLGYEQTTLLSWVTGITELAGGALLILGLFTPAAAAAVLGVMANVIWVKVDTAAFAGAVELETSYAAAAFALLFTGAGRISLDRNTPWLRRAPAFGFVFLLLAAGLSVVTLVVLR
ncbi:DoxX family protein [Actinokineospora sp.]|uniref:DoxX family protein n=1 Tax=Actinokineospora sp. TaxID=1872133 RepID=UPI004037FFAC